MNELYWITRLDSIVDTCQLFTVFGTVISIFLFVIYVITKYYNDKKWMLFWKKISIVCTTIVVVFGCGSIFIPNKKDAMLIWSVGGTIDYIKTNGKIQQLPDKCVDALDAWVESLTEEENKE